MEEGGGGEREDVRKKLLLGKLYNSIFFLTLSLIFCSSRSFVIEKQPPQVIKTSNRFSASVRSAKTIHSIILPNDIHDFDLLQVVSW